MNPVRSISHRSELGDWEMHARGAAAGLEGIVQRYCGYRERGPTPLRRRESAQGRVTVILNLGPRLVVGGANQAPAGRDSFVAAIQDSWAVVEHEGTSSGVQVDLSPLGAQMLLGLPMHELSEIVVPLDDVIDLKLPLLLEQLAEANGWAAWFELLDRLIARRVERARRPRPDVAWAWRRLRETDGRVPIGALADELGCSRRHLIARFREGIGPAPKTAARILRFQRASELLGRDDGGRFAEIAADCGYYDQAHMNRDFRELAGATPGGFGIAA